MARGQRHVIHLGHIPRADDVTAAVWIVANAFDQRFDLINSAAIGAGPRPPLRAIDRTKLAMLISPLIPDMHVMIR